MHSKITSAQCDNLFALYNILFAGENFLAQDEQDHLMEEVVYKAFVKSYLKLMELKSNVNEVIVL